MVRPGEELGGSGGEIGLGSWLKSGEREGGKFAGEELESGLVGSEHI